MAPVLCPVVIGRDAELAALDTALACAARREGQTVVVTGEPGVGKSRLAREVASRAAPLGIRVVSGRAVPSSIATPYRPLSEALLQLCRDAGSDARAELAAWLETPGASGAVTEHARVSPMTRGESLMDLLQRHAPAGAVLILEDLHWADPDTVAVLDYLADNIHDQPVMILWTLRSTPRSDALDAARRVRGRPAVLHISLDRLPDSDVEEMVCACCPTAGRELLERVRAAAEGVPLLVEEVLASPGVPQSFADTVRERLDELDGDERSVVETAAVLGRHFDWELLAPVSAQPPDVVTQALAHAVDSLLMSADGGGLRFRHALTREAVLDTMLPPRQRAIAATALAAVTAARPRLDGAARDAAIGLAMRSGDAPQAGALLRDAGRDALSVGALATAIDALRRATDVFSGQPEQPEVGLLLIEALALAGRVDEAAAETGRLITRLGHDASADAIRVEAHLRLAHAAVAASRWSMARHQLDEARRVLGRSEQPSARARLAVLDADVALAADDVDRARSLAEKVLAMEGAPPDVCCHALEIIGRVHRFDDLSAARAAFERGLVTAETADLPLWRLRALHELGTIFLLDHAGVDRLLEARHAAEEMGAMSTAAVLDLQLSAAFTCRWDLDRCDSHARAAIELAERFRLDQVRAKGFAMLAGSASMRADLASTDHWTALAAAAAPDDRMIEGFGWVNRGFAVLLGGDAERAVEPYSRGATILSKLPHAEPAAPRAVWPVLLASLGDRRAGHAIAEARRLGVSAFRLNVALIGYAEAVVAGRAGEARRADDIVATVAPGFVNGDGWADLVRYLAAPSAAAHGWGNSTEWLTDARDGFVRRGLHALAARCTELVADADANPWADAGITPREADVLRHVIEGLSNKEIAARIGVSPRTVEKHVESLLRKTDARSRTELASTMATRAASPRRSGTT